MPFTKKDIYLMRDRSFKAGLYDVKGQERAVKLTKHQINMNNFESNVDALLNTEPPKDLVKYSLPKWVVTMMEQRKELNDKLSR